MFYSTSSTSSSTSSLVANKAKTSYATPKNYEAAFGTLSSSFGLGSAVPSLPSKSAKSKLSNTSSAPSHSPPSTSSLSSTSTSSKNYEAAFGGLSSSSPARFTPSYNTSAPSPKNYEEASYAFSSDGVLAVSSTRKS